jgi:hypothetical protein
MVKATTKGHERDPRVERTEDIEAGRRTRARGGGVGAVRFEYGGGSGIGVGSGNYQWVLPWGVQADGRLRVSVGAGK